MPWQSRNHASLSPGHVVSSRPSCAVRGCITHISACGTTSSRWHVCAGCQNTKLTPLLDGAPNFRQVEGLPVYGVAIPTVRGLRNVLEELGAAHGAHEAVVRVQTRPLQEGPAQQSKMAADWGLS